MTTTSGRAPSAHSRDASPPSPARGRYDAFLSYHHASQPALVEALQSGLERFATPWYRPRTLRVFRDTGHLAANPDLWDSIQSALVSSEWFVLVATPGAAQSAYVNRELRWWLENRSPERILLVLAGGHLRWDDRSGTWHPTSDALPPALASAFPREPLWVDLSRSSDGPELSRDHPDVQAGVAKLTARIRDVPLDDLVGDHVRLRRRARRLAAGTIGTLALLLVCAVLAGSIAVVQRDEATRQRNEALRQARIATARQLASTAESLLDEDVATAQLLAAEAYRMDPTSATRAALLSAAAANPHLVRQLDAGEPVTALAGSADRSTVLAGTASGGVYRWSLPSGQRELLFHGEGEVSTVATSGDGRAIAAFGGDRCTLWVDGKRSSLAVPYNATATACTVSASGRYAVATSGSTAASDTGTLTLLDLTTGATRSAPANPGDTLGIVQDREVVVLQAQAGRWERLGLPGLDLIGEGLVNTGVHSQVEGSSPDAAYFTFSNGSDEVPVWQLSTTTDPDEPTSVATVPGSSREALVVSPDGTRLATADAGTIYVTQTRVTGERSAPPVALTGHESINSRTLTFYGDGDRLLSASGQSVSLWDLSQTSRLSSTRGGPVPWIDEDAARAVQVDVRRDGGAVALTGDYGDLKVLALDGRTPDTVLGAAFDADYHHALWNPADGLLIALRAERAELWSGGQQTGSWTLPGSPGWLAARVSEDGRELVGLRSDGSVVVVEPASGRELRRYDAPALPSTPSGPSVESGDVSVTVGMAAFVDGASGSVGVLDLNTHLPWVLEGRSATGVLVTPQHLLVRRDGAVEVWDYETHALVRTIPLPDGTIATNPSGTLLAQVERGGMVSLTDLHDGRTLGELPLPPATLNWQTGIAFTSDGRRLVTAVPAPDPGTVLTWAVAPEEWLATACRTAGRQLTEDEWERYVGTLYPGRTACTDAAPTPASVPLDATAGSGTPAAGGQSTDPTRSAEPSPTPTLATPAPIPTSSPTTGESDREVSLSDAGIGPVPLGAPNTVDALTELLGPPDLVDGEALQDGCWGPEDSMKSLNWGALVVWVSDGALYGWALTADGATPEAVDAPYGIVPGRALGDLLASVPSAETVEMPEFESYSTSDGTYTWWSDGTAPQSEITLVGLNLVTCS